MDVSAAPAGDGRPASGLRNGGVSFWHTTLGEPKRRPPLTGPRDTDVCIVGAGFTGLWTAYYLKRRAPHLEVVVVEKSFAGYGASGRNGGFAMAALPGSAERYAADRGADAVRAMQRAMIESVDEVVRIAEAERIDPDVVKGGYLKVAVTPGQYARQRSALADLHRAGMDEAVLLSARALRERVHIHGAVGGMFIPHCARIQPAKLVRGLADAVETLGVRIYESTPVTALGPHRARTPAGDVRARYIVRATEAYSAAIPGYRRTILPMNSAMVATGPLAPAFWDEVGWAGREAISEAAHAYAYMQRTADDRIAIGIAAHRDLYAFASRTTNDGSASSRAIEVLRARLATLFPALGRHGAIEHAWSGVFGAPRDWCASVGLDQATGLAWAGGYAGHGVATSNLAGRTLCDLIVGEDTELTRLPWVGRLTPRWELEPLRWLGAHAINAAYRVADRHERRDGGRTSPIATLANRISGVAPL